MNEYNNKCTQLKNNKKKFKRLSKKQSCRKQDTNQIKSNESLNLILKNSSLFELPHTSKNFFDKNSQKNLNINFLQKYNTENKTNRKNYIVIGKRLSKTLAKVMIDVALVASSSLLGVDAFPSIFNRNYEEEFRRPRNRGKERNGARADEIDPLYFYGKNNNQQPQTLVHTFGTHESCARICPRPCTAQELEDLAMMQRWICPTKSGANIESIVTGPAHRYVNDNSNIIYNERSGHSAPPSTELFQFSSQFLLIIVPLGLLTIILFLIIWCRKCSKASL